MRLKLQLALIIALFTIAAFGQKADNSAKSWGLLYIGPKASIGGAWISNSSSSEYQSKILPNYEFGAIAKIGITERLSIEPELLYSRKGSKSTNSDTDIEVKNLADYLGIPILAKLSFLKFGKLKIHATGGVYNNVTLSNKIVVTTSQPTLDTVNMTEIPPGTTEEDVNEESYRKVDFGFSFGAGFEYELSNGLLAIDIQIDRGVVDIYKNDFEGNDNKSQQNTTVGLTASYLFDVGKIFKKALSAGN